MIPHAESAWMWYFVFDQDLTMIFYFHGGDDHWAEQAAQFIVSILFQHCLHNIDPSST